MTAKSERFEMRLDDITIARVDAWGVKEGIPSRAEAIRRLIEIALTGSSKDSVTFSDGEKLLVVMLRDLYRHLEVGQGEIEPDFVAKVIWGGHFWAPRWELPGLFHDHEDDPQDVRLVVDVLDMWNFLERGYEELDAAEKAKLAANPPTLFGKVPAFPGFDGNNEASYLSIARFLIEEMNRFSRFKGRELNSHFPSLGGYRRMLEVFEPLRAELIGVELNRDQITSVLNAFRPSS